MQFVLGLSVGLFIAAICLLFAVAERRSAQLKRLLDERRRLRQSGWNEDEIRALTGSNDLQQKAKK